MRPPTRALAAIVVCTGLVAIIHCGKKSESTAARTHHPVLNAGFEMCNDDPTADFWDHLTTGAKCDSERKKGSGFMPTVGTYFMEMTSENCVSSVEQDSMDLSDLVTLKFDWEATGTVAGKAATANILFDSETLWTKSYSTVGAISEQKAGESVNLSALGSSGTLKLKVDTTVALPTPTPIPGGEGGPVNAAATSMTFRIDNIQVCETSGKCWEYSGGSTCGSGGGSTTGGTGGTGGGTQYCSTGKCYSYREGICCARSTPYACKGLCYASTGAALSAGGCTDFRTTCY